MAEPEFQVIMTDRQGRKWSLDAKRWHTVLPADADSGDLPRFSEEGWDPFNRAPKPGEMTLTVQGPLSRLPD